MTVFCYHYFVYCVQSYFFFSSFFFIFNWRIIALQSCVGLCHTTTISHKYKKLQIKQSEVSQKEKEKYCISMQTRKTSTSASLTMLKPLTVWITTNWKIL